jgi:hypothetical protein
VFVRNCRGFLDSGCFGGGLRWKLQPVDCAVIPKRHVAD